MSAGALTDHDRRILDEWDEYINRETLEEFEERERKREEKLEMEFQRMREEEGL